MGLISSFKDEPWGLDKKDIQEEEGQDWTLWPPNAGKTTWPIELCMTGAQPESPERSHLFPTRLAGL